MSYTRTITSNGNSISQEGGQSFNQQLDDIQEQIEEGGGGSITDLGTSSGTANALAGASLVDTATTFTAGRLYRIRTNAANSGAATCSINGGTGVAMKKSPSSAALASGDIADATELLLYYDGTNLQVLSGLTVSATDSTKVPLAGGTWTGPMVLSGNFAGSSAVAYIGQDANGPYFNCAANTGFQVWGAGTLNMIASPTYGLVHYVTQSIAGSAYQSAVRTANGLEENVPSGKSYIYNVNGAPVGHWPLTPSDMPQTPIFEAVRTTNQSGNTGSYANNTVQLDSIVTNDGTRWSNSSGVLTCLVAGRYLAIGQIHASGEIGAEIFKNSSIQGRAYGNGAAFIVCASAVFSVDVGDTVKLTGSASVGPTFLATNTKLQLIYLGAK